MFCLRYTLVLQKTYILLLICVSIFITHANCTDISSTPLQGISTHTPVRFPHIKMLTFSDSAFKQYSQDVSENYMLLAKKQQVFTSIYTYTATEKDTILSIAARCNIPYDAIVTLNSIAFIDSPLIGKTLFLPTSAGLFISEKPQTPLEFLLKTRYSDSEGFNSFQLASSSFFYIPDARFSPTERTFFTDSTMIPPLAAGVISSSFGMRISPFTGENTFHNGTDIAAPRGTPVFASKSGIIANAGVDNIYGNYVIIQHDNNTQSLYAHLDSFFVATGDITEKGVQIGTVGSTGLSTGDHLHFEIRIGRQAQDPSSIIKNFWQ